MTEKYKYIFGPVPSRRLGFSLGVDIIPIKTCTQNCIYCQLCVDSPQVVETKKFAKVEDIARELEQKLAEGAEIDCVTISGSGEPTLNDGLSEIIEAIKRISNLPVVVITNGTLLWKRSVQQALSKADVVMPSLDACDEDTFKQINHPHPSLTFDMLVQGLIDFRRQFKGKFWLEVFIVAGINSADEQIIKLKDIIDRICPDKIQLNTAVRPTTAADIEPISEQRLHQIAAILGDKAEIIAKFSKSASKSGSQNLTEKIIETIKRRPCTSQGLCDSLGADLQIIENQIEILLKKGIIRAENKDNSVYYVIN